MERNIEINGVTYMLKNSLRNHFIFEETTGHSFNVNKTFDWIVFFYSTLLGNNEKFYMDFGEFVLLCDENPEIFTEFLQFIIDSSKQEAQKANNDTKKKTNQKRKK